jgi:hypothetical protein
LNKLFFYLKSPSISFKYSLLLSGLSIIGYTYGMENREDEYTPLLCQQQTTFIPHNSSQGTSNEVTAEPSRSSSANARKRKTPSMEAIEGFQKETKRPRREGRRSSINKSQVPSPAHQLMPQVCASTARQLAGKPAITLDNLFNFAQSSNSQARYAAAAYLKDLVLRNDLRARKLIADLSYSKNIEERSTVSRALADLVRLNSFWAQNMVDKLGESLNEEERKTAEMVIMQLIATGHQWGYNMFDFLAHWEDRNPFVATENSVPWYERSEVDKQEEIISLNKRRAKSLTARGVLFHLLATNNRQAINIFNSLIAETEGRLRQAPGIAFESLADLILTNNQWAQNTFALLLENSNSNICAKASLYLEYLILSHNNQWAKDKLITLLASPLDYVRATAVKNLRVLVQCKNPWAIRTFMDFFESREPSVRVVASEILGVLIIAPVSMGREWVNVLSQSLIEEKREIAATALKAAAMKKEEILELIIDLFQNPFKEAKATGLVALQKLLQDNNKGARNTINKFVKSADVKEREIAASTLILLIQSNNSWAKHFIAKLSQAISPIARQTAAAVLAKLLHTNDKWGTKKVNKFANSNKKEEKETAEEALKLKASMQS